MKPVSERGCLVSRATRRGRRRSRARPGRDRNGARPRVRMRAAASASTPISPLGGTGWPIAVLYPEREMLSDLRVHSIEVAAISVFGTALPVLVMTLVSQTITRPLVALSAASDRLGQGGSGRGVAARQTRGRGRSSAPRVPNDAGSLEGLHRPARNRDGQSKPAAGRAGRRPPDPDGDAAAAGQRLRQRLTLPPVGSARAREGGRRRPLHVARRGPRVAAPRGGETSRTRGCPRPCSWRAPSRCSRSTPSRRPDPSTILERLNASLVENNDARMFATLFCGLL